MSDDYELDIAAAMRENEINDAQFADLRLSPMPKSTRRVRLRLKPGPASSTTRQESEQ